ncbi:uncharacterized protein [Rutidosis leptorrhynchoides]|uniref:uncharacterized protein n=1 Tax=Rutidosis leptorrhynchoides TaxID=125765 RepID=UPI003A998A04
MKIERNNQSVIARLMDFNVVPRQQHQVYGQQRVFSENYIRNFVSVSSNETRPSRIRRKSIPETKKILRSDDCFDEMGLNSTTVDYQTNGTQERNFGDVEHGSIPSFLRDGSSIFGWEFKKQLLERSKRTKFCKHIRSSSKRVCNLGEAPSALDLELKQRAEMETRFGIRSSEGWRDKSVSNLPISKQLDLSSSTNIKFKKMSNSDSRLRSGIYNKNVSANSEVVELSCSSNALFVQDSQCEAGLMSMNRIDIHDELPRNTGEAYLHSPNSVLEPENSSSFVYGGGLSTDLHGLSIKLQILKSASEGNHSNANVVTLGEGDSTESSLSLHEHFERLRCYGSEDTQQFSYLLNFLNKLGFDGEEMELSFEKRHPCEHMLDSSMFETLEKLYNKQESWNKSDRRLLFDRINFGLTETVRSKPLRRKMTTLFRDIIAEELWNMLVSQEKDANADLSMKVFSKEPWLEFSDEVDFIAEQIESFLFNELLMELVVV